MKKYEELKYKQKRIIDLCVVNYNLNAPLVFQGRLVLGPGNKLLYGALVTVLLNAKKAIFYLVTVTVLLVSYC